MPPQARVSRSMFLLLARRSPTMPSLANMSNDNGSIPYNKMTPVFFFQNSYLTLKIHNQKQKKRKNILFFLCLSHASFQISFLVVICYSILLTDNQKHFLKRGDEKVCIWENSNRLWKHFSSARVSTGFLVLTNIHSCFFNS